MSDYSYIVSNSVSVFPSARRGVSKSESRLVTESAIASIVNKLIDSDGFIITDDIPVGNVEHSFEFNIHGYYFKVASVGQIYSLFPDAPNNTTIYGVIELDRLNNGIYELSGQDENDGFYKGIKFTDTLPSSDDPEISLHYLALFNNATGNWAIVEASRYKFDIQSTGEINIDGGQI